MRLPLLVLPFALALGVANLAHGQSFSTLEERMSAADFRRAGLEKLSPEELAALNAWLQQNQQKQMAQADSRGFAPARGASDDRPVRSRLIGTLDGFRKGTVFRLENGQVWTSIDPEAVLEGVTLEAPAVTVEKSLFGTWRLRVEGYNTSAKVERVQ